MKLTLRLTVFALCGTLLLWFAYLLLVPLIFRQNWATSGQFGDTFGALNALFTGCAFVVVLATLIHQSREIEETKRDLREELELQRRTTELIARQAEALTEVARLNALTARIEGYHVQIADVQDSGNTALAAKLRDERRTLLLRLDGILRSHGD